MIFPARVALIQQVDDCPLVVHVFIGFAARRPQRRLTVTFIRLIASWTRSKEVPKFRRTYPSPSGPKSEPL